METVKEFLAKIKDEETAILATEADGKVTMRMVSPVSCGDTILIFTSPQSDKYRQLQANPNCCFAVGGLFLQARAEFVGPTMKEEHADLRSIYSEKFPGAFDENMAFGGRDSDFIKFKPVALTGWSPADEGAAPIHVIF